MGYAVSVQGRLLLPARVEAEAFSALRDALWRGEELDGPVPDLKALAALFCAGTDRDGDWIVLTPAIAESKWSDRASSFYGALRRWALEGDIVATGEDGAEWSYSYRAGTVTQTGTNGYDGTTVADTDAGLRHSSDPSGPPPGRPPRLRSNVANLMCSSTNAAVVGHPAPWTTTLTAARLQPGLHSDLDTDDVGLCYVLTLLDEDDRSAREHAQFVSQIGQHASDSVELTAAARLAAEARMVIVALTRAAAFDEAQLARIAALQERLNALVIYEDQLILRGQDGTTVTVPTPD